MTPEMEEAFFNSVPIRDSEIPIFVYGTLRVGHSNYGWCSHAVKRYLTGATASGRIYFVRDDIGYPVAKFDEKGIIVGDILWFDPKIRETETVIDMERRAGYSMNPIKAAHEGVYYECFGFHYQGDDFGKRIVSGDWACTVYPPDGNPRRGGR
jgi:gamma-glutamylcyclotransferase (GGCT)/AIG2-like uncharacterized protein YtfP